jgi:hypothetical protein
MAFLGKLKRSEEIPITLTLDASPTGTPQYRILNSSRTEIVAASNLSGSGLNWYKTGQNVGVSATVGSYLIEYTAVIDGVTRYAYDTYEVTVNEIDDVKTDTETIIANIGVSEGLRSVILNIKDGVPNPVSDVTVVFHNAANDATPLFGIRTSDTLGATTAVLLNDATYTIRLLKNGVVNETQTIAVTQDETFTVTVTTISVTPPSDPGLCKLFFFPQTLSQVDVTDAVVRVKTSTDLALVDGIYVDNRESLMVADTSTDPDNYYINAKIGTTVRIIGPIFGFNHEITVPDQATLDLSTLVTS